MNVFLTVLSIIGIVIGSVLGLIILLILILLPMRVRAVVKFDDNDGFRLWAGLGPILLKLFPTKKKKKKSKKAEKAEEKTAEEFAEDPVKTVEEKIAGEEDKTEEKPKKKGFGDYIKALKFLDYLEILNKATKHFLSKIYFHKLHLDITVASSDASKTAQMYGKLDAAIFPLLGLLDSKKKIKDGEVHIRPDFTSEKMKFVLDTEVCFRLFRALHAGIIILIYIYKTAGGKNNVRK